MSAPTFTASGVDVFGVTSSDAGTTKRGYLIGTDVKAV